MNSRKIWFFLTGWMPRRLPRNDAELSQFRSTMIEVYGVPNNDPEWLSIYGNLTSVPPFKERISWNRMAAIGHRLETNKYIHAQRTAILDKLNGLIQAEMQKMVEEDQAQKNANSNLVLPPVTEGKTDEQAPPKGT